MTQSEKQQALQKYFAGVLRQGSKGDVKTPIDTSIIKHLSRKELITIVFIKHDKKIPSSDPNLMEMENEELLQLIGDEMYILAYLAQSWCNPKTSENSSVAQPQKVSSTEKSNKGKKP